MKFLKSIFLSFLFFGSTFCYNLMVHNKTDVDVQVVTEYGGFLGACAKEYFNVSAHRSRSIGSGACCFKLIRVFPFDNTKKEWLYKPHKTGYGISCRNNEFTILKSGKRFILQKGNIR